MKRFFTSLLLTLAFTLVLAPSAKAETAQWIARQANLSYSSFRSFYSCDYAEDRAEAFLKQLGAKNVRTRCSGGLPDSQFVNVRATFEAAVPAARGSQASFQRVTLSARESCDFNEQLIRQILPFFTVRNVQSRSSCWDSQGRVGFTLDVLK